MKFKLRSIDAVRCEKVYSRRNMQYTVDYAVADWLHDHAENSDLCWRDYIAALKRDFHANASHISDCFTDTAYYSRNAPFSQRELETAIVRTVFDAD